MFTIRTNNEMDEKIAYLRLHKVRFTPRIKKVIDDELSLMCNEFKRKEKRIPNAPDWVYDD